MALFGFDLWRGFRTGQMRFRLRYNLRAEASRASDPRGFWIYALLNLASVAVAAFALYRVGLQKI